MDTQTENHEEGGFAASAMALPGGQRNHGKVLRISFSVSASIPAPLVQAGLSSTVGHLSVYAQEVLRHGRSHDLEYPLYHGR